MRAALAADSLAYSVHFDATGNRALDDVLSASSQLVQLRTTAPAGAFALVGRAEADIERLETALESFGFYRRRVTMTIDGRTLDDPDLPAALRAASAPAKVQVSIELGPLFHLRKVTIDGDISDAARSAFGLESGAPAVASDVLAARTRLLTALQEEGHAFASVEEPLAYEDAQEPVLDVTFKVETGKTYQVGSIRLEGLKRVKESFLRRRLLLHPGEPYQPSRIERARSDLLALGVFSGITVRPPTATDAQGDQLAITFDLQERPLHAVTFNALYSSDLGGSGGATWTNRDLFGRADALSLQASIIDWGGSDTTSLGYNVVASLGVPDFWRRDQTLQYSVSALQQDLQTYKQTAATATMSLTRKISTHWTASLAVSVEQEKVVQEGLSPPLPTAPNLYYTLLSLPLTVKYDSTDLSSPLLDPLHGIRATVTTGPTQSFAESRAPVAVEPGVEVSERSATYWITQATVATYFDFARLGWTQSGRSVLALRFTGADAHGADQFGLPPDQRFYGGGSSTIRGFRYQSVGPQFIEVDCGKCTSCTGCTITAPNGTPTGGTELLAASLELRERFGANFGAAWFIDAGAVGTHEVPFTVFRCQPSYACGVGYGTGLRYYTPIGPIRLDIALPTSRPAGGDAVEVYVGLGQSF